MGFSLSLLGGVDIVPVLELFAAIACGGAIAWLLARQAEFHRQQNRLEKAFYKLLKKQQGQISLIQLAAESRTSGVLAREYLEAQASFFSASLECDDEGQVFYQFPKL